MLKFESIKRKCKAYNRKSMNDLRRMCIDEFNMKHPGADVVSVIDNSNFTTYPHGDYDEFSVSLIIYYVEHETAKEEDRTTDYHVSHEQVQEIINAIQKKTSGTLFNFDDLRSHKELAGELNRRTAEIIKENITDKGHIRVGNCTIWIDEMYRSDLRFLCYLPFIFDTINGLGTYDLVIGNKNIGRVTYKGFPENNQDDNILHLGIITEIEYIDSVCSQTLHDEMEMRKDG